MNNIIYLDNASKSIPDQEVVDKYSNVATSSFANPSSIHILGSRASREIDNARNEILSLLKMNNHQVIFTSGATESNNLAIRGYALKYKNRGNHLITTSYEHPSVLDVFKELESYYGFEVTYLNPDEKGQISVEKVKEAIRKDTILVSIMSVNNEIGSINPIPDIAKLLKDYPKIVFHVDAAQEIGKTVSTRNFNDVDLLTVTGHKIHGLVGTGVLIKKKNLELMSQNVGGGQEYNLRSGTNDIAGILAFSLALKKAINNSKKNYETVSKLSERLYSYLKERKDLYEINSFEDNPYIVNFSTINKKSSVVVEALSQRGIMVSSISACHSKKEAYSHVVKALEKAENIYRNTLRVSFSSLNTLEEVEILISNLNEIIGAIR